MKNLWKWIFGTQKRSEQLPNDDVVKAIKKQLTVCRFVKLAF
jgi:hypothetical protein